MSIGKQFLSAILAEKSVSALLAHGKIDDLFKGSEKEAWAYIKGHVKQYAAIPDAYTLEAHTEQTLVAHKEPAAYYLDLMAARHQELVMKKAMGEASAKLSSTHKDPSAALEILTQTVMQLIAQKTNKQVYDFRDAYDLLVPEYAAKFTASGDEGVGLNLGWQTFDKMSGSLQRGDMVSFVGRPGRGKTWQMLYSAMYGWNKAGKEPHPEANPSRMFVSMEMDPLVIQQRMASIQTHIGVGKITKHNLTSVGIKQFKKGLTEIKGFGAPFYVVDGNLNATVEDVWMLQRQLQPGATFIDGGYLMKHPTERDRFKRVAENAELMKKELASMCPIAVSWQFAKTASKKKKDEKITYDDIGYSDAIAQVSSIVLALLEDDNIETLNQRKIDILKGRSGETGSFITRWNFDTMDFSELVAEQIADLQFV